MNLISSFYRQANGSEWRRFEFLSADLWRNFQRFSNDEFSPFRRNKSLDPLWLLRGALPPTSCGSTRAELRVRIIPYYRMPRGTIEWWKRFLAASVSLVIGSCNGKTAGRLDSSTLLRIVLFRRAPFCVWKCWSILPLLLPTRISRCARVLSAPLPFIHLTNRLILRSFVHLPVHLFTYPYVRSTNSLAYPFVVMYIVYYYSASIFFARVVPAKLFFLLSPCWRSLRYEILNSRLPRETRPLRYYVFRRE